MGFESILVGCLILFLTSGPSVTMALRSHPNVLGYCTGTDWSSCAMLEYGRDVLLLSGFAIGLLFCLLTLLTWPLYYLSRYCCKCCGSHLPRRGGCCPSGANLAVYTKKEVVVSKFVILGCTILAGVGLAVGLAGNSQVDNCWNGIFTALHQVNNYLFNIANSASTTLTEVNSQVIPVAQRESITSLQSGVANSSEFQNFYRDAITTMLDQLRSTIPSSGLMDSYTNFRNALTDANNWIDKSKTALQPVEDFRQNIILAALIVPIGLLGLSLVVAVLNMRKYLPMVILAFAFPICALIWFGFAVHGLGCYVFADVYYTMQCFDDNTCPAFSGIAGCNQMDHIADTMKQAISSTVNGTCDYLTTSQLCLSSTVSVTGISSVVAVDPFQCAANSSWAATCYSSSSLTRSLRLLYTNGGSTSNSSLISPDYSAICVDGASDCSMVQCALSCQDASLGVSLSSPHSVQYCSTSTGCDASTTGTLPVSGLQTKAKDAMILANAQDTLASYYQTTIQPNLSCRALILSFIKPFQSACADGRDGLLKIFVGSCLCACALDFGFIALSMGQKRWMKLSQVHPQSQPQLQLQVLQGGQVEYVVDQSGKMVPPQVIAVVAVQEHGAPTGGVAAHYNNIL